MNRFKKFFLSLLIGMLFISNMPLNVLAAYSGTKAANYAKKHATKYNTSYPKFTQRGDCTNFASQCVNAGGISKKKMPTDSVKYKHIDDIYKTKNYWTSGKYTRTTKLAGVTLRKKTGFVTTSTWSVVSKNTGDSWWGFYNYMKARGASVCDYKVNTPSKLNKFIKDCSVGDILQLRTEGKSKTHSVIVTDKSYDSKNKIYNMKIAYHTTDTPPTDFRKTSWEKFGINKIWTIIKVSKI